MMGGLAGLDEVEAGKLMWKQKAYHGLAGH